MYELCSTKCNFIECVDDLNHVITKATLHQVKEYIRSHCFTAVLRHDLNGRTPLHIAASCGKTDIVRWICKVLATNKCLGNVGIDSLDRESNWSALHRALYYGRIPCAMELLKNGANMWLKDRDGCNLLDMVTKDIAPWINRVDFKRNSDISVQSITDLKKSDVSELYTWGVNENMTLAQSNQKSKKLPELVKYFSKRNISIKQVVMSKFHSIFVTQEGAAYSCGNGRGGRLGNGSEDVFIDPQIVDAGDLVIALVSSAVDHSVFVSEDGQLLTCGLNDFRTLGINPPPKKSLTPQKVTSLRDHVVAGCCAAACHTVAWTSQNALYTFGTNAGQLGHGKGQPFIIQPRQVSSVHREGDKISCVHACDSATVIATVKGVVFLLHNYVCRKIVTKQLDIMKLQVGGGMLDHSVISQIQSESAISRKRKDENSDSERKDVKVLLLKKSGDLLSWNSAHCSLDRCQFDQKQLRWVSDVSLSGNGMVALMVAADGMAYLAKFQGWIAGKPARKGSTLHKQEYQNSLDLMSSDAIQKFQLEQIPCAFRCHTGVLGSKGRNFSLLQSKPSIFLTQIPSVDAPDLISDMRRLLEESDPSDLLHDVQLRLRREGKTDVVFPAHKFILASRSSLLRKLFLNQCGSSAEEDVGGLGFEKDELIIEGVHPKIFKNLMQLIYTGTCDMLKTGSKIDDRFPDPGKLKIYWSDSSSSENTSTSIDLATKPNQDKTACFELLKSLSNSFGIQDLSSQVFSSRGVQDNVIVISKTGKKPHFLPTSLPHLTDCEVQCDDGGSFQAHKCILASRIPFFHGMLSSPWIETASHENRLYAQLKVPVPSDVFKYVLDFAYMDSASSIHGANTVESLCEVLASADLLLMDRLKQIAEVRITPLLTLKNVAMVEEVASAFNSAQLYKSCLQFACHHLPALLHTPAFHFADQEFFEGMETYYRSQIPYVFRRSSPPSMEGPNVSHIPKEDSNEEEEFTRDQHPLDQLARSPKKRRPSEAHSSRKMRSRKSHGIMLSDLLNRGFVDEEDEILMRIAPSQDQTLEKIKTPESDFSRLSLATTSNTESFKKRSSSSAIDTLKENSTVTHAALTPIKNSVKNPTKVNNSLLENSNKGNNSLLENSKKVNGNLQKVLPSSGPMHLSSPPKAPGYPNNFPNLAPSTSAWPTLASPSTSSRNPSVKSGSSAAIAHSNKPKKLSQKERKRLKEKEAEEKKASAKSQGEPVVPNAWGIPTRAPETSSDNFWASPHQDAVSPINLASPSSPTQSNTPASNRGPWQQLPSSTPSMTPPRPPTSPIYSPSAFMEIIESEKLHKERTERTSKKPLSVIQMEDQAMEELKLFYENSRKKIPNDQQHFTVTRLPVELAREYLLQRKNR